MNEYSSLDSNKIKDHLLVMSADEILTKPRHLLDPNVMGIFAANFSFMSYSGNLDHFNDVDSYLMQVYLHQTGF